MCEWATEVVIANYDEFEIQGYEEVLVAPTCLGGGGSQRLRGSFTFI